MDLSKFLTQIRKIVREEISIALEDFKESQPRNVIPASLPKLENKSNGKVIKKTVTTNKTQPKSKLSESELVRSVRESMKNGSTTPVKPQQRQQQSIPRNSPGDPLGGTFKKLPSVLREAFMDTVESVISGESAPLGADPTSGPPSWMGAGSAESQTYTESGMGGNYEVTDETIRLNSNSIQQPLSIDQDALPLGEVGDMPDFILAAMNKAGKVAKLAEDKQKFRSGN